MKKLALWLATFAICGQAGATPYCEPTDRRLLESDAVLVGEVVEYERIQLASDEARCISIRLKGDPSPPSCDSISAYHGHALIRVIDSLKGGNGGEVTLLVSGTGFNGQWFMTDLFPGQRLIFGLERNEPRYGEAERGPDDPTYRIDGFRNQYMGAIGAGCIGPMAEATENNIETVRSNLSGIPFTRHQDNEAPDASLNNANEGTCSVKQRMGANWRWVTVPCQ